MTRMRKKHEIVHPVSPEPEWCDTEEEMLQQDWAGRCYTAALRRIMVSESPDWVVVHGTVESDKVGRRIDHAWCERGEVVVDLVQPIGLKLIDRERYYRAVKPEVGKIYPVVDAMVAASKNGHHGPWSAEERRKAAP